jgi:2-alkenal reductase
MPLSFAAGCAQLGLARVNLACASQQSRAKILNMSTTRVALRWRARDDTEAIVTCAYASRVQNPASPGVLQVVNKNQGGSQSSSAKAHNRSVQAVASSGNSAGNIVTNAHVINDASRIIVRTASGRMVGVAIVGSAHSYDLAVCGPQASCPSIAASSRLITGFEARTIRVRDQNPFGLERSLTTGMISALKRRLPTRGSRGW